MPSNWRDPPRPGAKSPEQGSRITGDTGKSAEGERGSAGFVVAMKRSNDRGAKGVGHPVGTLNWANWKQEELAAGGGGRQLSTGWHEPCDGRLSRTDL